MSVLAINNTNAIAVGNGGAVLYSSNSGVSWIRIKCNDQTVISFVFYIQRYRDHCRRLRIDAAYKQQRNPSQDAPRQRSCRRDVEEVDK